MNEAIREAASQWMVNTRATTDPKALAMIVDRATEILEQNGGYISPSHFERAYLELVNKGAVKPFKGSMQAKLAEPAGSIPAAVTAYIERSSAFELQRRYRTDANFRRQYDEYQKQLTQASAALSVEDYRRMPAAVIAKKYHTDMAFRAQVDSLISRGLI